MFVSVKVRALQFWAVFVRESGRGKSFLADPRLSDTRYLPSANVNGKFYHFFWQRERSEYNSLKNNNS